MKSNSHFIWIDFLRGLSAFGIVLFHVRVDLWVGWVALSTQPESFSLFDRLVGLLSIPVPLFGSAVMLFFLVSGFCIHYPYAAGGRALELKSYSIRRFLRIYPPYLAAVIVGILVEQIISHLLGKEPSLLMTVLKTAFMLQHYGSAMDQMYSNPSLWSLPVELELYLVYPIFLWFLMRWGMKWSMFWVGVVSTAALAMVLSEGWYDQGYAIGHFGIYWIIWCAGAVLAEWVKRDKIPQWKPWFWLVTAATLCLALVVYFFKLSTAFQNLSWASFYFMVMLWGLTQTDPIQFLSTKVKNLCAFLGLISYSLYLIHAPFFKLCGAIWVSTFGTKPANFLIGFGFSVLSIILAYAFYKVVEAPTHKLARKLASPVGASTSVVSN